jgi:ATP-binding cassette subfamily B protein
MNHFPATPLILTKDVLKWLGQLLWPYKLKVACAVTALTIAAAAWLLLGQGIKLTVDEGLSAVAWQRIFDST